MKSNIILIGMPSSGKSTLGVLLAKYLSKSFMDTDLLIQEQEGKRLQAIQNSRGMEAFRKLEGSVIEKVECRNTVIATGGSAVYCKKAMNHLKSIGQIVFLDLPLGEIETRIGDPAARGVVMGEGMTLKDLYDERLPLYKEYAEITVSCSGRSHDELVHELIERT